MVSIATQLISLVLEGLQTINIPNEGQKPPVEDQYVWRKTAQFECSHTRSTALYLKSCLNFFKSAATEVSRIK